MTEHTPFILERTSEQMESEDMQRKIDLPIKKSKTPRKRATHLRRVEDINSQNSRCRRSSRITTLYKKAAEMSTCFGERFLVVCVYETTTRTNLQVTCFGDGFAYHSFEWRAVMAS